MFLAMLSLFLLPGFSEIMEIKRPVRPALRFLIGFLLAGAALCPVLAPGSAKAEDKLRVDVSETPVWDSNPLMLTTGASGIWGSETKAALVFGRKTQSSDLGTNLSVVRNQYNDSDFNSTDVFLGTALKKRSALWEGSLDCNVGYDTTRTDEITTFGRATRASRRLSWQVAPGLAYNFSPRGQMSLRTGIQQKRYEDGTFFTDYQIVSVSPAFAYKITELQTAMILFQAQRYDVLDSTDRKIDSLGPSIGWQYYFNPALKLDLSAGAMGSKYTGYGLTSEDWTINPTYSATLTWQGQRNKTSASVSRARQPYVDGTESDLTTLRAENSFEIDPKWTLDTRALYQKADQSSGVAASNLDNAWEESAALTYKAADRWRLSLSQKYRKENLMRGGQDADRNMIRLSLTYSFGAER